jgi:hypothetical protein
MYVAIKLVTPPVTCTTPDPAKSMLPHPIRGETEATLKKPLLLQTEWTATGYTNPVKKTLYAR